MGAALNSSESSISSGASSVQIWLYPRRERGGWRVDVEGAMTASVWRPTRSMAKRAAKRVVRQRFGDLAPLQRR